MKSILLCIDSSEHSAPIVEMAADLAKINGARIYLLHIGSLASLMKNALQKGRWDAPSVAALDQANAEVRDLQRRLEADGLDARPVASAGQGFQGLVNTVEDLKADMVLLPQELNVRRLAQREDLGGRKPLDIAARLLRTGMTI